MRKFAVLILSWTRLSLLVSVLLLLQKLPSGAESICFMKVGEDYTGKL
jgi:hypothetical protein